MSGGSHNYLYRESLRDQQSSYECMESSLRADGHAQAADRMLDLIAHLKAADAIAIELHDVMHDQEWADSHDRTVEDVCKTVAAWALSDKPADQPRRYRFPERCASLLCGSAITECALTVGHEGACIDAPALYSRGRGHEIWPGR